MSFRHHLLNLIDGSGISDRSLSLLATGNAGTVRDLRRGANPGLDTIEALLRVLGLRLEVVPLHEPRRAPDGDPSIEKQPEWAGRLRKEIRGDAIEILGRSGNGGRR